MPLDSMPCGLMALTFEILSLCADTLSVGDMSNGGEYEEDQGDSKPTTRSRGKKGSGSTPSSQPTNGRRKADETPNKTPAKKRTKGNSGSATKMPDFDDDDDDDDDSSIKDEGEGSSGLNSSGKKMTDEEKRKNFLERNRFVRSLDCIGLHTNKSLVLLH